MKYSAQSDTVINHEVENGPERLILFVYAHVCARAHTQARVYQMEILPHIL